MSDSTADSGRQSVFVYEFFTAGGIWLRPDWREAAASLTREGRTMVSALASDFATVPGVVTRTMVDRRFLPSIDASEWHPISSAQEHGHIFRRLAEQSDWTLLVAPEIDGTLFELCEMAERAGARLLSPDSRFVALASDKNRMAERLAGAGVRVPEGVALVAPTSIPENFPRPAFLKPCPGAGSLHVQLLHAGQPADMPPDVAVWRLERQVVGVPCSVSVLSGPGGWTTLPAASQTFASPACRSYLGGRMPLPPTRDARARALADQAMRTLPRVTGLIGFDLVLGDSESGSNDYVIEVNARVTTSYVGLRRALRTNLASAMLDRALGRDVQLPLEIRSVEFDAEGTVSSLGDCERT